MKAAQPEKKEQGTILELIENGRALEQENRFTEAIEIYTSILKKHRLNERAYNRLMILYRKQKDYQKESAIINTAIENFEKDNTSRDKKKVQNKIQTLSVSLGKLTGLMDKKGHSIYEPEPVAGWRKRLTTVQKLLKSKKK